MSSLEILKECIEFYEMCSQNSNAGCFGTSAYCLEEKLENGEDFESLEIGELSRRLIKNAIICWNYLYLTKRF